MMKKKITVMFLALALIFTGLTPLYDGNYADAASYYDEPGFTGKTCTANKTAAAVIDYVMYQYPDYSLYPGSGECWGYAETVSNLLASSRSTKYYKGLKFTKKNFMNKCLGVKAGTHLRMSKSKTFNGGYGHSVVLLKVTEDDVIWADNNGTGAYNVVAYHRSTADEFVSRYRYQFEYLNMVSKPTKYRISSEPKLAASSDGAKSAINLAWTRAAGANQYYIYRSYSKNGTYKRIGKTTSATYSDSTATLGSKTYYKVKAVKSAGSTMSNIKAGGILHLATPVVTAGNDPDTGQIQLSWDPIPKATSYTIYRWDYSTGKYVKLKNTTKCTFTDSTLMEDTGRDWMMYGVRAIYSKNAKANSDFGETEGSIIQPMLPAPQNLTGSQYEGDVHLTWSPVAGAEYYTIFYSSAEDGEYSEFDWTEGTSYTGYCMESGTWYFRVSANNGMMSEPVVIYIP